MERQAAQRQAAEAERRYEHARDMITAMQRELLPAGFPCSRRVRSRRATCRPTRTPRAGGDWFDATVLADGRVALVVGDVVGHGVTASATMGQLRAVLQDRLLDGGIEQALTAAGRLAHRLPGARAATVCAGGARPGRRGTAVLHRRPSAPVDDLRRRPDPLSAPHRGRAAGPGGRVPDRHRSARRRRPGPALQRRHRRAPQPRSRWEPCRAGPGGSRRRGGPDPARLGPAGSGPGLRADPGAPGPLGRFSR